MKGAELSCACDLPVAVSLGEVSAVFYIYADESGKHPKDDVVSVCGFVIRQREIHEFSAEWMNRLALLKIPPIHMGKIYRPSEKNGWLTIQRGWGEEWETRRERMLAEFARFIESAPVSPMGTVIAIGGNAANRNPTFEAFKETILSTIDSLCTSANNPEIGVVLDDDDEASLRYHEYLNEIRKLDRNRYIKTICFADDKGYPLLQAADMLAYDARNRYRLPEEGPSKRYKMLTKDLMFEPRLIRW